LNEIYVTPGDVRRIAKVVGAEEFYEYRGAANPAYLDQDDDPLWLEHVFRSDGTRRVLRQRPGGDCCFLTAKGCRLDMNTRPLVCRLYPYRYNAAGFYAEFSEGCPTELLGQGEGLLDALGMKQSEAAEWRRMLYEEILLEKANAHRSDLRPAA